MPVYKNVFSLTLFSTQPKPSVQALPVHTKLFNPEGQEGQELLENTFLYRACFYLLFSKHFCQIVGRLIDGKTLLCILIWLTTCNGHGSRQVDKCRKNARWQGLGFCMYYCLFIFKHLLIMSDLSKVKVTEGHINDAAQSGMWAMRALFLLKEWSWNSFYNVLFATMSARLEIPCLSSRKFCELSCIAVQETDQLW